MIRTKHFLVCALLSTSALGASITAPGQAVFAGTWRIEMSKSSFSQKPWLFYTSGGWFHCESCTPQLVVQADGQEHAITGHAYDMVSVAVDDQRTLHEVGKKDGKVVFEDIYAISADGKSLTVKETDYPMNGDKPATGVTLFRRAGALPAGVHPTSGNWVVVKATESENGLVLTYAVHGDEITMTDTMGESYTAKLDGSDAPVRGAYGWDTVSLKMINDHTIEETDKFKGRVTGVGRMTVSANGKTAVVAWTAKPSERTDNYVVVKQ